MDDFLDRMASVMEMPVAAAMRFRETPAWSSLKAFGILVTLENDFGRRMDIEEFGKMSTFAELAAACGIVEA